MLETFILWFLIGTAIKVTYEQYTSKAQRRRVKDKTYDLLTIAAVVVILIALVVS